MQDDVFKASASLHNSPDDRYACPSACLPREPVLTFVMEASLLQSIESAFRSSNVWHMIATLASSFRLDQTLFCLKDRSSRVTVAFL